MARTTVTVNDIVMGGVSAGAGTGETSGDIVNGMDFVNDGNVFLHVRNLDSSAKTLGLKCPLIFDGNPVSDYTNSITNGVHELIGPFPPRVFNQSNGRVNFDVNSTLLLIKAYRIPPVG